MMIDRLKFRAWNIAKQKMLNGGTICFNSTGALLYDAKTDRFTQMTNSEYVLMQCTGLRDKDGTLIYEGDLIEQTNYNGEEYEALYEVVWDTDGYCLKMHKGNEKAMANGGLQSFGHIEDGKLRKGVVVGNVWEHKHLIKEGK